jgi:hypothetical protein
MNNNNVLEEFFVWEEKNSTDHNQNLLKNVEQDNSVTTTETKINSTKKDWKDITDPKLRKKMRDKAWKEANKDRIKDKIKLTKKTWYEANKDKIKEHNKAYREVNKDKKRAWRHAYKDKLKERHKTDIQYKLSSNLRSRLKSAIRSNYKSGSAVRDLGCSIPELKIYLENKFQPGMSWDNYGLYGWHIDHIKPLVSFDLSDRKQLLEACHYTNLQPLWAKDNLSKSDKISNN